MDPIVVATAAGAVIASGLTFAGMLLWFRARDRRAPSAIESDYRALFEAAIDAKFVVDPQTLAVLDANAGARALFPAATDLLAFTDDPQALRDAVHRVVNGSAMVELSSRHRVEGREVELRLRVMPVRYRGRNVALVIAADISRSAAAERERRVKEAALDALVEGVLIADARAHDNPVIYANRATEQITGYTREELIGRNCRFLQGDENQQESLDAVRDAIRGAKPARVEVRNFRKDGTPFWNRFSLSPLFDDAGELTHFVGVQQDITLERSNREALQRSEERYRLLFESGVTGILIFRPDGDIVEASPQFLRMAGMASREELSRSASELLGPAALRRLALRVKNGSVQEELQLHGPEGQERWLLLAAAAFFDGEELIEAVAIDITSRKAAEAALVESDARLSLLISQLPAVSWTTDRDLVVLSMHGISNAGVARIGREGRPMREVLAPLDRELAMEAHERALRGESVRFIYRAEDATFQSEVRPLRDPYDGSVRGVIGVGVDVTEMYEARAAFEESEQRLRVLVDAVEHSLILLDAAGVVQTWNAGAVRITRWTPAEAIGRELSSLYAATDRPAVAGLMESAERTGRVETRAQRLRADGSDFTAEIVLVALRSHVGGQLRGFAELTRDITLQVRSEQQQLELVRAIADASNEWRMTFDSIGTPVLMVDDTVEVRRLNSAAQRRLRARFDRLIHTPLGNHGPFWERVAELVRTYLADDGAGEHQLHDEEGRTWLVRMTRIVRGDEAGEVIIVLSDISDLVALQASLRRSETMSAMGALLGGVAHEVRNPLFGISGTLDALEAKLETPERYANYLRVLRGEVNRLTRLMSDLLEYGKPHQLELQAVGPVRLVHEAAKICASVSEERGVGIEVDIDHAPAIRVDPMRITQALENLMRNAIQHSPRGGVVRVTSAMSLDGQALELCITDNGPGFAGEDLPRIFDPFFSRRRGGTGLGLSVVQKIVEMHGGEVRAQNSPEGGGRVVIRLPLATTA